MPSIPNRRVSHAKRAGGARYSSGPANRRAGSASVVLVSLLVVVLASIAVVSTVFAFFATEERKRAESELKNATDVIDEATVRMASTESLQGFKMGATRTALLEPIVEYYQGYIEDHKNDPKPTPQLVAAYFRLAGLHAKLGSTKSVEALGLGTMALYNLIKEKDLDPETIPSIQHCAIDIAPPGDWLIIKGADFGALPKHAIRVFTTLSSVKNRYEDAYKAFPEAIRPREELVLLRKYIGMFAERFDRDALALVQWSGAAEVLETLVEDRPDNVDYQTRLAEALVATGKLQKRSDDVEAAKKSLERAVELREKLAADAPQDEARAKELEEAKTELAAVVASMPAAEVAATPMPDEEPSASHPDEPQVADGEPAADPAEEKSAGPKEGDSAKADSKKDEEAKEKADKKEPEAKDAKEKEDAPADEPKDEPKEEEPKPAPEEEKPKASTNESGDAESSSDEKPSEEEPAAESSPDEKPSEEEPASDEGETP